MNIRTLCSAVLPLVLSWPAAAGESLPSDEMQVVSDQELKFLIGECTSCHGENGVSRRADIPSLAGKPAAEILKAVEEFYFYERHCPDAAEYQGGAPKSGARNMCDISERLTRQEVLAIGAHFEALTPPQD